MCTHLLLGAHYHATPSLTYSYQHAAPLLPPLKHFPCYPMPSFPNCPGVRVPRDSLLDAYASVSEEGVYSSPIPSVPARFGVTVGGLTTGRVLIATGAVDAAKIGVTIALRYGLARPQFGDKPIMQYLTHQRRLLPALAQTYALHLALGSLKELLCRKRSEDAKAIHVLSSGLKAAATWGRVEALQVREERRGVRPHMCCLYHWSRMVGLLSM